MRKCCGTCRWHSHEDISDGWVCVNGEIDRTFYQRAKSEMLAWEPDDQISMFDTLIQ